MISDNVIKKYKRKKKKKKEKRNKKEDKVKTMSIYFTLHNFIQ